MVGGKGGKGKTVPCFGVPPMTACGRIADVHLIRFSAIRITAIGQNQSFVSLEIEPGE